ncbi:SusD/RagB family nutrient-binding outer membrane lipoprotein [Terrimonas rubra]|uniref:SusD/RagB family nutrient-binding outer membrane lipoprotein n=1 Tax=Terrimonas rubra TaxID=1035890 RepID=A0ABW6ACE9_9BACT
MYQFKLLYTVKRLIVLLAVLLLGAACTKRFDKINTNPYRPTPDQQNPDNYSTGANFVAMINAVTPAGDAPGLTDFANSYQVAFNLAADCFSGYMGQAGDWNTNSNNLTYAFNTGWVNEQFNLTGALMRAWNSIKFFTDQSQDSLQFSVADIIKVTGIIRTTDSYGPVPYSAIITGTATPAYDSQESIYAYAFTDLIKARNILFRLGASAGKPLQAYDMIYEGDYLKWARYANSLILRLAIRTVYVDAAKAKQYAEEAVAHPAGLLTGSADNAVHSLKAGNGQFNFNNPLVTLTQNYQEARAGASIVSILTGYNDPRLRAYFKNSTLTGRTTEVIGVRSGINIVRPNYQPFSELNVTTGTPLPWMRVSEVYFLKAEGAIRGWAMGGNAKDLYESGIKAAFEEAGVTMPATYLADDAALPVKYVDPAPGGTSTDLDYASTGAVTGVTKWTIKWDEAANFQTKLHRIIMQKWIALYLNGPEGWAEYRRTGFPRILPVLQNRSSGNVITLFQARRLPYPQAQYNQNPVQIIKGISLLGGPDNGGTRLWWDKNTNIPR